MVTCHACACERVCPPATADLLYVSTPPGHIATKVRGYLRGSGICHDAIAEGVYSVAAPDAVVAGLSAALKPLERQVVRALRVHSDTPPSIADLMTCQPIGVLAAADDGEWLFAMMAEDRLTSHFQPIVRVSDPTTPFAYEMLLRGLAPDCSIVPPGRIFQTARDADQLFALDRLARLAAIRQAARHDVRCHLFINFNPTSIYDPAFCLATTFKAVREANIAPERVVFEVVESDHIQDPDHLLGILRVYRDAGFKVALDDLGAGYGSLNLLARLQPDFVKFDMDLVRGVDENPFKADLLAKLADLARTFGIITVAEGVETEGEWNWVRGSGIDLAQGYYLARPAATPPVL